MAKLRVALLFGGVSSEHEISCISAAAIADNMDADRYDVMKVGITKKGRWLLYPGGTDKMRDGSWETFPDCAPAFLSPDATTRGLVANHGGRFDVVKLDACFPALHGPHGEDGTVQGLLELAQIPYVGCGVGASADCMDKSTANALFAAAGIPHTPWMCVSRGEIDDANGIWRRLAEQMRPPVFVKPAAAGSSVGVSCVKEPGELDAALKLAAAHGGKIIIEQAVRGQEVECAVLGNTELLATQPGEVVSCNAELYDYDAKYHSAGASRLYLPARLPEEKREEVRAMALKAYRALGCAGLARVDFFVEEGTGRVWLSEINTLPGFTPISMYPKLMQQAGLSFGALVDRLILLAMERAAV